MKWQLTLLLLASVVAQPTPSDQCKVYDYVNGVCSQCVETYYLQVYFCLPCAPLCLCQNSSNFCTQCLTVSRGRYDVASYYDASLNRCWYCDEFMNNCAICDNALTCKLCYGGYLIDPATNQCSNNTCTGNCQICNSDKVTCKICQDGFNLDTTTGLCDAVTCQSNCLVCKNSTACLRCNLTYYAQPSDGTCQSCMDNCLMCNSADNCLNCTPSFVYQNGSCQNTTLSNCVIYSDDYSTCLNCQPGYYILAGSCNQCTGCDLCTAPYLCVSQCQEGYIQFYYNCLPTWGANLQLLWVVIVVIMIVS